MQTARVQRVVVEEVVEQGLEEVVRFFVEVLIVVETGWEVVVVDVDLGQREDGSETGC